MMMLTPTCAIAWVGNTAAAPAARAIAQRKRFMFFLMLLDYPTIPANVCRPSNDANNYIQPARFPKDRFTTVSLAQIPVCQDFVSLPSGS
jgi:hypothetical protein